MPRGPEVIVIGGGIIGSASGYYLSRAGKRVLLLEAGGFGCGASGACDDMILLQSKRPGITLTMAFASLDLYRGLSKELEADLELENRGGMILIDTRENLKIMEDFVAEQRRGGLEVEIVGREELKKRQPFAHQRFIASTYSAGDSQVNPFRVMAAFQRRACRLGLELKRRAPVTAIERRPGGGFRVTINSGEVFEADVVLNCAGAWAPRIGALLGLAIPIEPKRGQILITEPIPAVGETNVWSAEYIVTKLHPELAKRPDPELEGMGLGFAFSRTADGNCFIGSTREKVGYDKGTTYAALKALAAQVLLFFPVLRHVHMIRWMAGLRPAVQDGLPVIGEHPQAPGFFTAAGHEGDGIALAPITGILASELICGRSARLDISGLSPARFSAPRESAIGSPGGRAGGKK